MKSVMAHQFSQVPKAEIPRSQFDRSHGYKTTFDAGLLVPVFIDEALPGDTFNLNMNSFARLATPLVPIMDNLFMDAFFFAVPKRLIWENWEKFNGQQDNPDDSTDYLIPHMVAPEGGYPIGSLSDYFGIPTQVPVEHSSLWHRAYNLIWNEWFRDQNLQDSIPVPKGDGPDDPSAFQLKRRGKRHDYFTSSLPWPQKGPAVELPLGESAPVYGQLYEGRPTGNLFQQRGSSSDPDHVNFQLYQTNDDGKIASDPSMGFETTPGFISLAPKENYEGRPNFILPPYADLSEATAATINSLRQAFQLQKLYERDARGGTRYTEIIRSHFGVTSPDARLQRPEYLGGGTTPINISPIAQTSSSDGTTPQGNLAAMGTSSASAGFTKGFTEHSVIIGLVSVRADLTYQQGLNRMFSRKTRWDFYWPALSHIGEQAVLNKEIYTQGTEADEDVFGYQERYAEYRYKPSLITGKMRSSDPQSLDIWHLSQDFQSLPTLSNSFIEERPPIERMLAVPSEPHFIFDSYFSLKTARPMPVYSVPGQIDRF